jgi:hypothetical protein
MKAPQASAPAPSRVAAGPSVASRSRRQLSAVAAIVTQHRLCSHGGRGRGDDREGRDARTLRARRRASESHEDSEGERAIAVRASLLAQTRFGVRAVLRGDRRAAPRSADSETVARSARAATSQSTAESRLPREGGGSGSKVRRSRATESRSTLLLNPVERRSLDRPLNGRECGLRCKRCCCGSVEPAAARPVPRFYCVLPAQKYAM